MPEGREISWMPAWVHTAEFARFELPRAFADGETWHGVRPHAQGWAALGDGLRKAQSALAALPVARIAAAIERAAERWLDPRFPARRQTCEDIAIATGFSARAVERSLDLELRNYRAGSLLRALRRELGDPQLLDGFRADRELQGHAIALGPRITTVILTGNVPGLPALALVRALLVKSAVIAKLASGEPTFAAAFARTLFEVEPVLGDAIAVTYWPRSDRDALCAALAESDAVIAYGSEAACAAIRAELRPQQRYVEHGHKVSVAVVSRRYLRELGTEEVARRLAVDISTFNQHACIAPQAVLVEGSLAEVRGSARALAEALESYARECPLGQLGEADAAALQLRRASAAWAAAGRGERDLWHAAGLDWTLVLGGELLSLPAAGNRVAHVIPVPSLPDAVARLRPLGRWLQNVGLGALGEELWQTAAELARLGATRISEPGRMAEPSFVWHHDGEPCIARLLRWCDLEMHGAAPLEATPGAAPLEATGDPGR